MCIYWCVTERNYRMQGATIKIIKMNLQEVGWGGTGPFITYSVISFPPSKTFSQITWTLAGHLKITNRGKCVLKRLWWSRGSALPLSTQVRGFNPGRSRQDFSGRKNPQYVFLRKGSHGSRVADLRHVKDPWIDVEVTISGKITSQFSPTHFQGEKILSTSSFEREVKPWVPCRWSVACKRSLNWRGSHNFRQNYRPILAHTFPPFATRISCRCGRGGTWRWTWERPNRRWGIRWVQYAY